MPDKRTSKKDPQIMPLFDNAGQHLHYLVRGSGEPVLLIHGIGSSGADWAFQVPALEGRFRVVLPDLPGCGLSAPPPRANFNIAYFASSLWALLDEIGASLPNIVGFSLGGAVALEMALQRPASVPRIVLINSLASYRLDHWKKWLEARIPPALVRILGMRRVARLVAARVFPDPWQRPMRERAASVIGAVPAASYLSLCKALESWCAVDRLSELRSRALIVAAEHDYTPLAEKRALATRLGAQILVIRGSRHGTPFDSIEVTNASLVAQLTDQPLPPMDRWLRDTPLQSPATPPAGSVAEEHAAAIRKYRRSA
jgi:3-oxoadipate enol-lactonase